MTLPQVCLADDCYMPAILLLNDVPYCVEDYKKRNHGRI